MTHVEMYWFTRLDGFVGFGWVVGIILAIAACIMLACYFDDGISILWAIGTSFIAAIFICVGLFVPTQKEAAAIWLVPKMVNNEKLNDIASNTLSIVDEYTKEYLQDLVQAKKEDITSPDNVE